MYSDIEKKQIRERTGMSCVDIMTSDWDTVHRSIEKKIEKKLRYARLGRGFFAQGTVHIPLGRIVSLSSLKRFLKRN
jgi:hypothetical protein